MIALPLPVLGLWSAESVDAALQAVVHAGFVIIFVGMLMCVYRLIRGPHLADRALAVDTLGIQLIGLVLLLSMHIGTLEFIDGVLILSLLSFAGTVAMAQYIARPHLREMQQRAHEAQEQQRSEQGGRDA